MNRGVVTLFSTAQHGRFGRAGRVRARPCGKTGHLDRLAVVDHLGFRQRGVGDDANVRKSGCPAHRLGDSETSAVRHFDVEEDDMRRP